jgi:hypothetical protein
VSLVRGTEGAPEDRVGLSLKQAWDAAQAAVIAGDPDALERLLGEHPELIRALGAFR